MSDTANHDASARERAFAALLTEWDAVEESSPIDIEGWQRDLDEMVRDENALRSAGRWVHGRDDFFGVLSIHRAELPHSAMIAWLLDPCARHGLGTRVLNGLLLELFGAADCETTASALGFARVAREVRVGSGRLDIVVEAPGLYLVVENKVDSPEGDGQCDYYLDNVRARHRDARFVLLSPDGRPPLSDNAEVREAFKPMHYQHFAKILRIAIAATPASSKSGRYVAGDYLRTLEKEFCNESR